MKEIDWSKAPAWAQAFAKVIYVHPTLAEDYAWISADGYNVAPFGHCKNLCHSYKEDTFTLSMFRVVEFRPLAKPAITITKRMAILEAALRSCVAVMDRDLNGLALIQPELKEAKQALEDMYLVDAELEPWNGEGLPPVGTWCEMRADDGAWHEAEVIVHGKDRGTTIAIGQSEEILLWSRDGSDCRPIRTPDQIAAEEREKAKMLIGQILIDNRGNSNEYQVAGFIYDAISRKQVQP